MAVMAWLAGVAKTGVRTVGQAVVGGLVHTVARIRRIWLFQSSVADVKATPVTNMT